MSATPYPLVSIIIPLYNAERYIAETIQSALDQTWPNKEIIIVDDGSTDNSLAMANKYSGEGIKIISVAHKGASAARNIGIKEAKGVYIQFLDADDLLSENKIASQMELLFNSPNHVGLCATVHFQDGTNPKNITPMHEWYAGGSENSVDFLIKLYGGALIGPEFGGMIQPNAWLTPVNLIQKTGLWNEDLNLDDDGEYFCRIILASAGINYSNDGANYYRKFSGQPSLSAQKNHAACKSMMLSTLLKVKYLTAETDDAQARIVLARLLLDNAFNFYPYYKKLSAVAEKKAKELSPGYKFNPYKKGLNFFIVQAFGWKTLRYLQYLKHKII